MYRVGTTKVILAVGTADVGLTRVAVEAGVSVAGTG